MLAELILTFALQTNEPLYIREQSSFHRDYGIMLEVTKPIGKGFFFFLAPFVSRSKEHTALGSGGAIARLGWDGKHFGVALYHRSEHNFDRNTPDDRYLSVDSIELRWKLN